MYSVNKSRRVATRKIEEEILSIVVKHFNQKYMRTIHEFSRQFWTINNSNEITCNVINTKLKNLSSIIIIIIIIIISTGAVAA